MSSLPLRFRLQEVTFAILVICVHVVVISSQNETTFAPRQQPRVPKTPRTTTSTTTTAPTPVRRIATHPPWPNDPTPKTVKVATHAPWPGDPGYNRATHSPYPFHRDQFGLSAESQHLIPARSTYPPYVYGSSSGSHDAKKKNVLSVLDKDTVSGWAKEIVAYLAAPFMMPSAIGNAIGNIPSGLEVETLWSRITKSLKSALNRRSEERNAAESSGNSHNNVMKKKRLGTTGVQSLASLISKRFRMSDLSSTSTSSSQSPKSSSSESKKKSVDKKFRDIVLSRLVELLRVRKPHTVITHSSKSTKPTSSSPSSGSSSS